MKTIILIEDDPAIRDAFELIFVAPDFNMLSFESGEKILTKEVDVPGLFILDKNVSGTNGAELCRFIKSTHEYQRVPVILLSASPDLAELVKECGADDFIEKPFRIKTVRATVSKYIS